MTSSQQHYQQHSATTEEQLRKLYTGNHSAELLARMQQKRPYSSCVQGNFPYTFQARQRANQLSEAEKHRIEATNEAVINSAMRLRQLSENHNKGLQQVPPPGNFSPTAFKPSSSSSGGNSASIGGPPTAKAARR